MPIRLRLALVFTLITLGLVAAAGTFSLAELRESLFDTVDAGLEARAAPIVRSLSATGTVDQGELTSRVASSREAFAQVFDGDGRVVASSDQDRERALLSRREQRLAQSGARSFTRGREPGEYGESHGVRLRAEPVTRPEGTWVVVVGAFMESTETALHEVRVAAWAGGAALVVAAALSAWLLAGAALRPVERLRAEVAALSGEDAASGVAVPRTRDELAALARTLNELLGRIHAAMARERRFVADASHELRTPLAVLRTELELARRPGRTAAELAEAVGSAARETERLSRLAEDLLLLARSDEGLAIVRQQRQALAPIVQAAVAAVAERAAEGAVAIEVVGVEGVSFAFDADRVRQAVDNLLDNALRYAPPASTVRVEVERRDGHVAITVVDRGPGFPEDFLPFALERFRRADTARARDAGGAGLGLAIVDTIARAHGGIVEVENGLEAGARPRIVLPDRAPLNGE